MKGNGFSVLLSVYHAEKPTNLRAALDSIILGQTLKPNQVVLMVDGPIGQALEQAIATSEANYPEILQVYRLEQNNGLGNALAKGLDLCTYEIVARMDTDDISRNDRFEQQFQFLGTHPEIAVVGSIIEEFRDIPGDLKFFKKLPEHPDAIRVYSRQRSPMNHPSIMFKKSAVIAAGGYKDTFKFFEDYDLFIRMIVMGNLFYNIQEPLLYFRVGEPLEMIKRRSGWGYMRNEIKFFRFGYAIGHFSVIELLKALSIRVPIRLLPARLVLEVYRRFLRS